MFLQVMYFQGWFSCWLSSLLTALLANEQEEGGLQTSHNWGILYSEYP